mgnify:CR=1 FL=1
MQKIKQGDTVTIRLGKYRGKSGKVLRVFPKKGLVVVEKINLVKRHSKPTQKNSAGGIVEKEAPIPLGKVALIDPKSGKATRVGFKLSGDKVVRVAKASGEEIKS